MAEEDRWIRRVAAECHRAAFNDLSHDLHPCTPQLSSRSVGEYTAATLKIPPARILQLRAASPLKKVIFMYRWIHLEGNFSYEICSREVTLQKNKLKYCDVKTKQTSAERMQPDHDIK